MPSWIFRPSPLSDRVLAIIRMVSAAMFITFGTMKVFNHPPLPAGVPPIAWLSQAGIGGWMEIVGGALLVVGLLTRPVAFLLSGEMAVAYWQFHAPQSPWPSVNMGTPAILYCFLWLYLSFAGPGAWSLDGRIAQKTQRPVGFVQE